MTNQTFNHSEIYSLKGSVKYSKGSIVSKIIQKSDAGNLTLFAFDEGQNLSEHTAPYDAMVQVIDGRARVIINKKDYLLEGGSFIIMPANIPHALEAITEFKMLLVMIRG
ncbi:MAG TPA: cupin domain-containing protein [Bacteroidetes bacterium]|nr:cupin domain-containing protein [Bacteroidota bacterium]